MANEPVTIDAQTQRPTNAAPAEPTSPGTTVTDPMILKALNSPATKSISQDPEEQKNWVRQGFEMLRDTATPAVAKAGQYGPADVLQMGVSKATGGRIPMPAPATSDENATAAAKLIVPQTPAQAATYAAGLIPGVGIIPSLLRVGAAAGIGAGANAATGYDPITGAIEGTAGRATGEVMSGLVNRIAASRALTRASALDTVAVPKAIGEEIEAFKGATTPADIKRLALGDGYNKLGGWFGRGQKQIVTAMQDAPIESRALMQFKSMESPSEGASIYASASPAVQAAMRQANPGLFEGAQAGTMPLSEAFDLVKRLGATAFAGDKTALGFQTRQLYRQAQEDITRAIAQHDPQLATLYGTMRDQYSTGLVLLHAIKGNAENIFESQGNRIIFNPAPGKTGGTPLQNSIAEILGEIKNYGQSPTVNAVYRGGEIGAGDARLRDFLNTLWIRQHGGAMVPGASIHTGIPGMPAIVGREAIQPRGISPGPAGILGQTSANTASNLLDMNQPK